MTAITGVASFVYDAVDRRQSVTQGATTVTTVYAGYDPVQEQSPVGTVAANLQIGLGVDERFTRTKSGTTSTYLTDQLGSTVALANSSGTVATTYGYDPYGVTSTAGAANDNQYQFTGRQNDGTGLYYYRARYYNPAWGRFVSEDPIGLAGGFNLYAYVGGNPVGLTDPLGLYVDAMGGYYPDEPCPGFDYNPLEHPYITGGMAAGVLVAPFALAAGEMALAPAAPVVLGAFKSAERWANQMTQRGWTTRQIQEAISRGERFNAPNQINPANGATRYVHPTTGKSVVVDNGTGEVIHVGGNGFQY